jgi:hypothetical protein
MCIDIYDSIYLECSYIIAYIYLYRCICILVYRVSVVVCRVTHRV